MSIPKKDDPSCLPISDSLEDKMILLLTSISIEETKIAGEIQAATEKMRSISQQYKEQLEKNPSLEIDKLIRHNIDIEKELRKSIKKEMDFQLEIEELLETTSEGTESKKQ